MTYDFRRLSSQGNTLYDRLRTQFGERTQKSISRGLEASKQRDEAKKSAARAEVNDRKNVENSRKIKTAGKPAADRRAAANPRSAAAQNNARRQIPAQNAQNPRTTAAQNNARRQIPAQNAQNPRTTAAQNNARRQIPAQNAQNLRTAETAQNRSHNKHNKPNPYIIRFSNMKRPFTTMNDSEISIATLPRAYRIGMEAKRAIADKIVYSEANYVTAHRGYRRHDAKNSRSPLETSVRTLPYAYRLGEHMREVTQIETAEPTPKNARGIKKQGAIARTASKIRSWSASAGQHAEIRVRHTPFPIGVVTMLLILTITFAAMLSSFAQLGEYRSEISILEAKQEALDLESNRLTGLIEAREDVRGIEKTAINEYGMVSAELAKSVFIPLASSDRVEVIEDTQEREEGFFAAILSAIAGNLGSISEYIN